ncbi:MAG: hypothetical protein A2086_03115 [Spirochaetes bacterium GWD1_27_9]|nr:MAG: hypothetical protein A2Z98_18700 [Spirochaetes bacterium GWB1_27_13]OHD23018.1 MAG: hypothetical protein A2Y34_00160 [Spirochaetes bacterium GWC1_27_15]OHD39613.1 MAG: hypothetical protein A2086_03115 [Spirochaetes bacterium GWD1_27_9]
MSVNWIEYKGKKILYCDYRCFKQEKEWLENIEIVAKELINSQEKVLSLTDFRNAEGLGQDYLTRAKVLGKEIIKDKVERSAVIGISGMRKLLLNTYNLLSGDKMIIFEDEITAKEFLVK